MSDLTQAERWEYYRESMPPVEGMTISFDTVRIVGGRNLFRCHDPERAKLAASAPLLLDALLACQSVLARLVHDRSETSVLNLYAAAIHAEQLARTTIERAALAATKD